MSFTGRKSADPRRPDSRGLHGWQTIKSYRFRGHFLDLKTLAFSLTNRRLHVEIGMRSFRVERGKIQVSSHGELTEEYLHYNRRDVEATARLAKSFSTNTTCTPSRCQKQKHSRPPQSAELISAKWASARSFSARHSLQPYVGYAQTAYFGGRTSAHIRKVTVPVVYVDFLSMYPTVNSLMNLWQFLIARNITVVGHCHQEII